jgi:hypothetical protein
MFVLLVVVAVVVIMLVLNKARFRKATSPPMLCPGSSSK